MNLHSLDIRTENEKMPRTRPLSKIEIKLKENLIKNSNFIQSNCSESNSLKELIWSFDNYSIISTSANELNEIKKEYTLPNLDDIFKNKSNNLQSCG